MPVPQYPQPPYPFPASGGPAATPPLWAPYCGAPLREAVRRALRKHATFTGQAGRAGYWWWALVGAVVGIVLNLAISAGMITTTGSYSSAAYTAPAPGPLSVLGYVLLAAWGLTVFVPSLALTVRRRHDVNLSGWMVLLGFVPFLGGLALLIMTLLPSNPAGQRFDQLHAGA